MMSTALTVAILGIGGTGFGAWLTYLSAKRQLASADARARAELASQESRHRLDLEATRRTIKREEKLEAAQQLLAVADTYTDRNRRLLEAGGAARARGILRGLRLFLEERTFRVAQGLADLLDETEKRILDLQSNSPRMTKIEELRVTRDLSLLGDIAEQENLVRREWSGAEPDALRAIELVADALLELLRFDAGLSEKTDDQLRALADSLEPLLDTRKPVTRRLLDWSVSQRDSAGDQR